MLHPRNAEDLGPVRADSFLTVGRLFAGSTQKQGESLILGFDASLSGQGLSLASFQMRFGRVSIRRPKPVRSIIMAGYLKSPSRIWSRVESSDPFQESQMGRPMTRVWGWARQQSLAVLVAQAPHSHAHPSSLCCRSTCACGGCHSWAFHLQP